MDIRKKLAEKLGEPVTVEEFEFAVEQFENNHHIGHGKKIYDDTAMDILATNIDFYRRNGLGDKL